MVAQLIEEHKMGKLKHTSKAIHTLLAIQSPLKTHRPRKEPALSF